MVAILVLLFILALAVLPSLWVRGVLAQHGGDRPDFPGTGGELARHLLDEMGLRDVKVEETSAGDHYDPQVKAVRLLPQHHGGLLTRHPAGALIPIVAGVAIMSMSVVMHLTTLPVEFDASFGRALPVLKRGRYIPERDLPAARSILRAAAFTYVAAALMSLINIARWLRVLRI